MSENRREAVVYDLQFHGQEPARYSVKMRWWMCKDAGRWKVWDFEMLEEGNRLTSNMDAAMAAAVAGGAQAQTITQAATGIRNADDCVRKGDYASAEKTLKTLDGMTLAPFLIATRQYSWAALHLRQARYSDVIKDCDSIVPTGQDIPGIFELRATAENKLGRYDAALASTEKWEAALGPDRELYYERGFALTHLHRPAEAAVAFGKSLDEDPDSAGSLAELSQVLPAGQKQEVGTRFSRTQTPGEIFTRAVPILQRKRDLEGMRILIAAYRARNESANDPWLNYYDAELKVISKQYKEAAAELLPLLPQASEAGKKVFASEYLYSSRLAGESIRAYVNMPDQRSAFKDLAQPLLRDGMKTTLADLVRAMSKSFLTIRGRIITRRVWTKRPALTTQRRRSMPGRCRCQAGKTSRHFAPRVSSPATRPATVCRRITTLRHRIRPSGSSPSSTLERNGQTIYRSSWPPDAPMRRGILACRCGMRSRSFFPAITPLPCSF